MKHQVTRLSPHQNGKVFGVLMALTSLIFLVPFSLVMMKTMPPEARAAGMGMGVGMVILMPVLYLVLGYVFTAVSCLVYNQVVKIVGGIEYETTSAGE